MEHTTSSYTRWLRNFGLLLIALNTLMIILSLKYFKPTSSDFFDDNGFFWVSYICTAIYFVLIQLSCIDHKRRKKPFPLFTLHCLSLCAFSMSAYLLNLSMGVFSQFAEWSIPLIITMHVLLVLMAFHDKMPELVKTVMAFVAGISLWMCIAQCIHVAPLWPISMATFWFFGISLHSLVPLIILATLIYHFFKHLKSSRTSWSFASGVIAPMVFIAIFMVQWQSIRSYVHEAHATQIIRPDLQLPTWVVMSQLMDDNWITEQVILGDFAFDRTSDMDRIGGRNQFKKYDPLVSMSLLFFDDVNISNKDRRKIIESKFDGRHQTHRKLWSGANLITTEVLTEVKVFPEFANAYVEKTFFIKNKRQNGRNQQEALYTFYLPEGTVASSLSLWVNGVEEKSRLSTKAKADSAYTQIVGRERRDPALMHWQEGNRITVTVFPCTPSEDRQFKIGLTVPLNIRGGALWVDNIYFKGPDFSNALETTILRFESAESYEPILPPRFEMIRPHTYQRTGDYEPMWTVGVSRSKLSEQAFSFDSHSYTIKRNKYEKIPLNLERVYLDINSHWTDDELKVAFELFDPRMTFVNIDGMYNLENQDMRDLAERQRRFQFSLFPFQDVSSPESALVITKSAPNTPNLSDLKNSAFEKSLKEHLTESNSATRVIDLSEKRSAYLQTLQQFKQVEVTHFDIENVVEILKTGNMPTLTLSENEIEIGNSGYHIARSAATETVPTGGPDHLMRLYNYNKILRDLGPTYFDADTYAEGELLDLANAAFVVSPISSLVVLESQKDYDRFDIKKNKNSLNNASMNSSGAVPEPHEWALIILALLVPLYFRFKKG